MADENKSRRGFLELILGGSAVATLGAIVYPAVRFLLPPATGEADPSQLKVPFTRVDIEAESAKAKYFKYGRTLGIIFITDTGDLRALAATCTHLDCTVQHRPDKGIIWCSCHNGQYDLEGKNIAGPPPRPLEIYKVAEVGDEIFVSRENG